MAEERPRQTAADYVTIVLSPALIMGLVGSLVFFLLEVFYRTDGPFKERLQFILFFFVFGAVLVGRIAIMGEIAGRANLYGGILAVLTYIGLQSFIEYPPGVKDVSYVVNLLLVVVVWWCSVRLVKDCTHVDEEKDMSGEGLLQAAGLEGKQEPEEEAEPAKTWWEAYQRYRARLDKKGTLGVWVVYFSLAALPLFGLGQAIIPLTSPERRRFTFWLMMVYVACGLGLLLTTCFLGLRRYLRQRNVQMPAAMTGMWLMTGAGLVLALLILGALMPRPYAEYSLFGGLEQASSKKREASKYATKSDSSTEGEGKQGESKKDGKGEPGKTAKDGKEPGGKDKDKGKSGEGEKDKGKGDKDRKDKGGGAEMKGDKDKQDKGEESQDKGKPPPSSPQTSIGEFLAKIGPVLKWVVFGILAVIVLVALLRGGLGWLANFTEWAKKLLEAWRAFWERLFGGGAGGEGEAGERGERNEVVPPRAFASFSNPFDTGEANRLTARQLVRYTFAALEAWTRERDLARKPDETALEFTRRLGDEVPGLEDEAMQLAGLLTRAEYAGGEMPGTTVEAVREFWEKLEKIAVSPLSA